MADRTGGGSGFKFHPKCLKQKLTHLCFADDLLIFCEASLRFINTMQDALLEFEELSGLKANPSKSSFFCYGISPMQVKENLLKRRSFWSVSIPQNCSWSWRKILKLRDIAKRILKFEVGNEENIFLRLDSWHPSGILFEVFGHRAVYDAYSSVGAKLSSVILDGDWFWRPNRSEALVEIQARVHEISFGPHDKPLWIVSRKGTYVSSETWDFLREKKDEAVWWKLVWFPHAIPKHAFILWLAMQDRPFLSK
ncbi:uncharacterized protein LOC132185181 [Corylus avellana]|uniref:uncharacterized protein LOC132185181 n=1 Tax=Corylus avellana TaxID=13451 RepID=UPI00286B8D15|nr:uncharacterized protein LOC132185181 [Corylus avellana]